MFHKVNDAYLIPTPELNARFLPRCGNCGGIHPEARRPSLISDICPDCGSDIGQPGPGLSVKAAFTGGGPLMKFGQWLHRLGMYFLKLSKRIEP